MYKTIQKMYKTINKMYINNCEMLIIVVRCIYIRKEGLNMYYTEIGKIIEAGLNKDTEKVQSFAMLLAKKMSDDGEMRGSQRIKEILKQSKGNPVRTDALVPLPVDQESRLNIVEIENNPISAKLILSEPVEMKLKDFLDTIENKSRMQELGLEFNQSLLLYGAPGCGKTSAAKYVAEMAGLPLVVARLDTLISSLLGNTAKNIHKIFDYAKKQRCVLFLDEFDAIAKARDDQHELGELKRVVNSLLQNIDDYCKDGILIAATNHHELLDRAIWRRFQTVIEMPKPEIEEIRKMTECIPIDISTESIKNSQWIKIYQSMLGLSYSDIKNIINNASKKIVINNKKEICFADFVAEIYLFKNHGDKSVDKMIRFMNDVGVPKKYMISFFNTSRRKLDAYLGGK